MNQRTKKTVKPKRGAEKKREAQASTALPSFIIEQERVHKKFHEEIDDAMRRAYKCHPGCRGPERCQWRARLLHVLDLKQAIKNVTQVIRRFYFGEIKRRGRQKTPLITQLKRLKEQGYTIRQACEMSIPDFNAKEKS